MSPSLAQILEDGRQEAGLSARDLWIGYCSLGGMAGPDRLDDYLAGRAIPELAEYDVIAQALNDTFIDAGGDHPVPYAEDLQP